MTKTAPEVPGDVPEDVPDRSGAVRVLTEKCSKTLFRALVRKLLETSLREISFAR